jgi:hypothetical protein
MQSRICGALIASKILKSYVQFARDNDSKDVLRSQADQFEEYANECLKCCYNYDEGKACEIAIRRINLFGGVSSLQVKFLNKEAKRRFSFFLFYFKVAVDADDKNFVGQPCCDQLLNNVWFDKMEPYQSTLVKRIGILLSILTFGLLAPILVSFRQNESDSNSDYILNKQKQDYGMTVNEAEEDTKDLLPKTTNR